MLLRRTRESMRVGLPEVAEALRIRVGYLEAIETGAFERLPGPVYAVGFVRTYAEFLSLDGEEAVRRFKRDRQGRDGQSDLSFPAPIAERSIPGGRILLTALVLAVCGYGLWYYLARGGYQRPEQVAAVPAALTQSPLASDAATPAPAATPATQAPKAAAAGEKPSTDTALTSPTPPRTATELPPPPALAAQTSALPLPPQPEDATSAPPQAAAPGHTYGAPDGPVRVILRFTGDCWMQVKDGNQDVVFSKLLHAGDIYRVPDQPSLSLRVGDSDALAIWADGKIVSLPPENSRVRNIPLDPARLVVQTTGAPPASATEPALDRSEGD
jgi:cytoskeleton protein RodZ